LFDHADEPIGAAALQDRDEFRAPRRQLGNRAAEIDVDGLPGAGSVLPHQVIERHRFAIRLDDPAADDHAIRAGGRLGVDLKALAAEIIEPVGVNRDRVAGEHVGKPLLLIGGNLRPARPDRDAGHQRQIKGAADARRKTVVTGGEGEPLRFLHDREEIGVKPLDQPALPGLGGRKNRPQSHGGQGQNPQQRAS